MKHLIVQKINYLFIILFIIFLNICSLILSSSAAVNIKDFVAKYPKNQLDYFRQRDALLEAEQQYENRNYDLTRDEIIVDQYLGYLKWREGRATRNEGLLPSKPIEQTLSSIVNSDLYKALKKLPKGAILRTNEDDYLSKKTLFDIIWNSTEIEYLYIVDPKSTKNPWKMDFFVNPPTDNKWIQVITSGLTKEEILKHATIIGLMTNNTSISITDFRLRKNITELLRQRASSQLVSNMKIKRSYLNAMFKQGLSEGVVYFETRRPIRVNSQIYVLDHSGKYNKTHGKRFLGNHLNREITLSRDVAKTFASAHRNFVGHKRIFYASQFVNQTLFDQELNFALKLRKKYPSHVAGFDAGRDEEGGYSTMRFIESFLSLYKNGISGLPLFLTSMETSWPEDLMSSDRKDDLIPVLENGYDAVLLRAKRVGFSKEFVKKPLLVNALKELKIAVEICPISNQIMGLDPDLRNHFGQNIFKEGVPIVLAPDDPGTFGSDSFTVDWYMAYVGWGLNLGDLKQLALNSLNYSGMEKQEKIAAIENHWIPSWKTYIKKMKKIACVRNYSLEALNEHRNVTYSRLFPAVGIAGTKVHIYGRNFELAICQHARCKFGKGPAVDAAYVSNQHLICSVPHPRTLYQDKDGVEVSVSLGSKSFQSTRLVFRYVDVDFNEQEVFRILN